jgi:hypothetical protein
MRDPCLPPIADKSGSYAMWDPCLPLIADKSGSYRKMCHLYL